MKLDKNRPSGQIYGHHRAVYEQDGKLFNGAGELIEDEKSSKEKVTEPVKEGVLNKNAEQFVRETLAGGKMNQDRVYAASQEAGMVWDDVTTAAAALNVRKYKQGTYTMWQLV